MPVYEYRCEDCTSQFEATQSVHARPEDTICPHCKGQHATRLLSAFASTVKGTKKPTFTEMKAYDMLNERMDKFAKLPPIAGRRTNIQPNMTSPSDAPDSSQGSSQS
ncbi:MAG TPA: zinc ribbon domain-containing protein [Nitrospiraceae bacterium]|nr:zinc ribbon domain-containing protein [Nitrospiraceae bacterium]